LPHSEQPEYPQETTIVVTVVLASIHWGNKIQEPEADSPRYDRPFGLPSVESGARTCDGSFRSCPCRISL